MGETKQEEAKEEAKPEEKKEEKIEEKQEEKKEEKPEEKKEEAKPSPPVVLFVDLHCAGCAKKIERSILKCRGVERVEVDMVQNQVTVKGMVDPQALCSRVQKKTSRRAEVISPPPPAEGESKPEVVASQASGITTVELHVNMHCEACAQQLRRKILKMRGVQTAETELRTRKVTVTGTMNAEKLVEYIHRRTGKLAKIVPQPPREEEKKEEAEKKTEEKPPEKEKEEDKKEENAEKKEEEKAPQQETAEGNKDGSGKEEKGGGEEQTKEGEGQTSVAIPNEADMVKRMVYWNGSIITEEEMAKRTMMHWMPVYVMERPPPPPQIFSDENPNACCIS
ncbi:heavy metal-associated isoprenylated plant protein 9-like isoform X2 [Phoenix dactylifera]|uniref:Heavy metal-associated isoprenylated plant protein 9-like isoform X2 n=1 Tax=Phoenix dactylifera TaxID=42345 RepID=A0A8B7CWT9_PHODC|nr:heavy metal-associated isoprenylated plant protein 9-like isoform X2 [Phoenix dactylifera]